MLGYDNLMNYFKTLFSLTQHHKWNAEWVEKMPPWEKFIYVDMLKQFIQQEEEMIRSQAAEKKAQSNLKR